MVQKRDQQLIETYRGGDVHALDLLIEYYLKSVYGMLFQYVKNVHDAEDLSQEVFLRVWKHLNSFDHRRPFHPWLFTITKNIALDFLKKKKFPALSVVADEETQQWFLDQLIDQNPTQEKQIEQKELKEALDRYLKKLSLKDQAIITLHNLKEWTFDEIASAIHEPLNTVKSRYRRALATLQKNAKDSKK